MGYAEDLLDQIVVDDHAKKGACGDHRVNRTKMACSSPRAYMTGQHFKLLLPISPKKTLGEFLIAQRAIKKEACHGSVVICPVQENFRNRNQQLAKIALRLQQFTHATISPAAFDAVGQRRPEEAFLGAETAKTECFVYAQQRGRSRACWCRQNLVRKTISSRFRGVVSCGLARAVA